MLRGLFDLAGRKMLFGCSSDFSIECEERKAFAGYVSCGFRFWIAGESLGEWEEEVVLGTIVVSAEIFMKYSGSRHFGDRRSMNASDLLNYIDKITRSDERHDLEEAITGRYQQKFLLTQMASDSIADEWTIVVEDRPDDTQRIAWKRNRDVSAKVSQTRSGL
jgi:hypothetical protein